MKQCQEWDCPDTEEAVALVVSEMQTQSECIEGVDPRVIRKYHALKEEADELAKEIERHVANAAARKDSIVEIRTRWLEGLQELLDGYVLVCLCRLSFSTQLAIIKLFSSLDMGV